jgi:hypothetical protein
MSVDFVTNVRITTTFHGVLEHKIYPGIETFRLYICVAKLAVEALSPVLWLVDGEISVNP